ncbi:DUF4426 domain-containing protein [Lysobacter sp. CFH 32150]|uniref:DUF4426 domain-containing protein n=1 Tax=Lysobacter sp. CFH 32150 TaxID=2927128 RepID=UPI001FA7FA57|nr:DUF4426 domain-containing protein [Lysobacter sp. CFH 32150]MCI4568716.1 DUF4426 domain-containing protein [Lysobacter sp. CFH 32150]
MRRLLLAPMLAVAACSGAQTPPAAAPPAATANETVSRIGDVTIRASVVQTSTLNEAVARGYGIVRDEGTVLLLVAVRQGPEANESALPAQIMATATDLRGGKHDIPMRELRSGDLLDYVGTVAVSLPDTLRFDLTIVREGGASSTMQFSREFFPR